MTFNPYRSLIDFAIKFACSFEYFNIGDPPPILSYAARLFGARRFDINNAIIFCNGAKKIGKRIISGSANKLYKKQAKAFAKQFLETPVKDSFSTSSEWVGTTNFGIRKPNFVIIHHTATNNCSETLQEFTTPGGREASAHYVICEDGTIYHMLNDLLRSHHAGESRWGNTTDLNSSSIGIELNNNGNEPFTEAQINSLTILLGRLKIAYKIRGIQAQIVRKELDQSPYPALICGDFNDVPNSYTYFQIRKDWQDAFLSTSFGIGRTYLAIAPTLRIDYILADNNFIIKQFDLVDEVLSDHLMIVADISIR